MRSILLFLFANVKEHRSKWSFHFTVNHVCSAHLNKEPFNSGNWPQSHSHFIRTHFIPFKTYMMNSFDLFCVILRSALRHRVWTAQAFICIWLVLYFMHYGGYNRYSNNTINTKAWYKNCVGGWRVWAVTSEPINDIQNIIHAHGTTGEITLATFVSTSTIALRFALNEVVRDGWGEIRTYANWKFYCHFKLLSFAGAADLYNNDTVSLGEHNDGIHRMNFATSVTTASKFFLFPPATEDI